jgi:hypothetical protein
MCRSWWSWSGSWRAPCSLHPRTRSPRLWTRSWLMSGCPLNRMCSSMDARSRVLRAPGLSLSCARRPSWTPASTLASVHFGSTSRANPFRRGLWVPIRKVPKVSRMAKSAAHPARSMVSTRLVPMMCSRSNGSCSQHLLGWETFVLRA